jgi:hypothetical protein
MDEEGPSTPDEVAADLRRALRTGVTAKALAVCPAVLALSVVHGKSASDHPHDLAAAAHGLLREVVVFADGERNGPAATLLGLATGTRGTLLKHRRQLVADQLFISVAHLRTSEREIALIEGVAEELYALDSAYRLRHKHRTQREREPPRSRLGVDWLDRHQAYRRVWTPVEAMRRDVVVLLGLLQDESQHSSIVERLILITWRYAQFITELERFVIDYGGLWLLADVESEVAAAQAVQRLTFLVPLGEADDSWLRLSLLDSESGELEPFADRIEREDAGQEVLGAWLEWAKVFACTTGCDPSVPGCRVHQWLEAADELSELLDADWLAVADWYRLTEPQSSRASQESKT